MNPFVLFMASPIGRAARILGGIALIIWGMLGLTGNTGFLVAFIGLVPLLAGMFDFCIFGLLFKNPFKGAEIRGER